MFHTSPDFTSKKKKILLVPLTGLSMYSMWKLVFQVMFLRCTEIQEDQKEKRERVVQEEEKERKEGRERGRGVP